MYASPTAPPRTAAGFTLVEIAVSLFLLSVLLVAAVMTVEKIQSAFAESQRVAWLSMRAEHALERLTQLSRNVSVSDPAYTLVKGGGKEPARGLSFGVVQGLEDGVVVYLDDYEVHLLGPGRGSPRCDGLIVGRAPKLKDVRKLAAGYDKILGTTDDDTSISIVPGVPVLELLLPAEFAPRDGEMLQIELDSLSEDSLLCTLRVNLTGRNGEFLLEQDLKFVQRIALRP